MTTPNNQPPSPAIPFAVTGIGSAGDGSGTTAADLATRTQSAIMDLLKQTQIQQSPGWTGSSQSAYAGLTSGIPYSLAIVEQFVSQVTGLPIGSWATMNEALLAMEGIASNQDLQNNWTTLLTDFGLSPTDASGLATAILDAAAGDWKPLLAVLFGSNTGTGTTASLAAPAVADKLHTPQVVSNFSNAASIAGGGWASGGWSFDPTVSWQGSGGSAKTVADGTLKAMAGVMVPAQPGQTVAVGQTTTDGSAITTAPVVQWAALAAASGVPIQFQLIPYSGEQGSWVAGTPFVVAQSTSLAPNQPSWLPLSLVTDSGNHVAAGIYTVPSSGVTAVQARLIVNSVTTVGSVWWNNCQLVIAGGYLPNMAAGFAQLQDDAQASNTANQVALQAVLAAITGYTDPATFWATINTIYQTWATTQSGLEADEIATVDQMIDIAFNIDPATGLYAPSAVGGTGGAQTLIDTFDQIWNQSIAALGGDLTAIGLPGFAQLLSGLAINSTSPMAPIVASAQDSAQILAIVNSEPVQQNLEATVVSSGDHKLAVALSSTPITQTASLGTIVTAGQAKTFGFLQWMGERASPLTDFVANFYLMDDSGNLVHQFTTSDIGPGVPGTMTWILDTVTSLSCAATDLIGIEFQVITSGGVVPWGFTAPAAGSHPTSLVKMAGFSQNWGGATATDIAAADIGWTPNAPYVGIGVGSPPPTPFFPKQTPFTASDTHTMPAWAMFADLVTLGGAGGGEGELGGATGYGGTGGSWNDLTLEVGVDIAAETVFTITIGTGGAGGPYFTPGGDGTATTISWDDIHGDPQSLVGAFGFGGNHALGMSHNTLGIGLSPSPQTITYQGFPYSGGGDQWNTQQPGIAPGGAGAGGQPFQFGTAGAAGEAWIVDRQS